MANSLNIQIILLNQKKYLSISKSDSSCAKFFMSKKEFQIVLSTGMKVNALFSLVWPFFEVHSECYCEHYVKKTSFYDL